MAPSAAYRYESQNAAARRKVKSRNAVWRNTKPTAARTSISLRRRTSSRSSTLKRAPRTRTSSFSVVPAARSASRSPAVAGGVARFIDSTAPNQQSRDQAGDGRQGRDDADGLPGAVAHVPVGRVGGCVGSRDGFLAQGRESLGR